MLYRHILLIFAALLLHHFACESVAYSQPGNGIQFERKAVFEEVWRAVDARFYDPNFGGIDWNSMHDKYLPVSVETKSYDDFSTTMNQMLAELHASHTRYLSRRDPKYYQLLGVFGGLPGKQLQDSDFQYSGIGIETTFIEGKQFVQSVYDGSVAAEAGLLFGDEIISADELPFHPIDSFKTSGEVVTLSVRRHANADPVHISVTPKLLDGRTMFESAMSSSVRVIEEQGRRVGYIHAWSFAGEKYYKLLCDQILDGELSDCDCLILDLRDGWGGAHAQWIDLFFKPVITMGYRARDGSEFLGTRVWSKPVTLLVNERSTSGKEAYAFAFKKHQIGKIVGATTAGAVLAGSPIPLSNGDLLYFATLDVRLDGQRIEGIGVQPDLVVERPIKYAAGSDPQLQAAVNALVQQVGS